MNKLLKSSMFIPIFLFSVLSITCLTDDPLKRPFQSFVPFDLGDGWVIASPDNVNIDGEALKDIYKYVHEDYNIWQIRSLLVIKDNRLVAESYMKDNNDITNLRAVWSCTKQVTGILTGIAIENGIIDSVSDQISKYLPQTLNTNKAGITIENLLMMKSGINFSNSGYNGDISKLLRGEPSQSLNYILGLGMRSNPGTQFHYNDGDPHIISAILQERTGKTMKDWAKETLFDRIGITRLQWLTYKDGITFGAIGIYTTPRELGKIGQLVLNDGMWGSENIVSSSWINAMTSSKVPDNETNNTNITFGYLWWKDTVRSVMYTWGQGGQFVFINKDKNLIVVITSEHDTDGNLAVSVYDALSIYDRINKITEK